MDGGVMRGFDLRADVLGLAALAGGAGWWVTLMRPILAASTLGPICSHHGLLGPHCPSCYAALALVISGLAVLAAGQAAAPAGAVSVRRRS